MKFLIAFAISTLACMHPARSASAQIAIVVSSKSPITTISQKQIEDIFLGRSTVISAGIEAIPIDHAEDSPLRREFYSKVTRKNTTQVRAHWLKLSFAGKGEPPVQVEDPESIKRFLATNLYAVSYLDAERIDASVRPLLVIP